MKNFLENFLSEDTDSLHRFVENDYGILFKISSFYRKIDTVQEKILTIFTVILIISTLSYQGVLFLCTMAHSENDMMILFQSFHYFMLFFLSIHWLVFIYINRKRFARILKAIDQGLYKYNEEQENYKKTLKNSKKNFRKLTIKFPPINCIFVSIFVEFGPVLDSFIRDTHKDMYSTGGVSQNIPVPTWIPYGTDTIWKLFITWLIKLAADFFVGLVFGTSLMMVLECASVLSLEMELLINSLQQLTSRTEDYSRKFYKGSKFDINSLREDNKLADCYKRCLKENAIHYQRIITLFLDVQTTISVPLLLTYISESIFVALSATAIVFGKGQVGLIAAAFGVFVTESVALLLASWCGEQIRQSSENLRDALYATNWIYAPKDAAIYIQIMSSRAQKSLTLVSGGLFPVTFETFSNIMNTGYSYFNLIYASNP